MADTALGGGFPAVGLSEIHLDEARDGGSLAGFALALAIRLGASPERPLLWIVDESAVSETGLPYLPGLLGFGLTPSTLLVVRTRKVADAAWAGEEAASAGALSAAIMETRGNPRRLELDGTRRLHLRALRSGLPLLLLRQSAAPQATAAPLRLRVRPGPAAPVADLAREPRLIGRPVFRVSIEKSRAGRPRQITLEWNPHERRFGQIQRSAPLPVDRPAAPVERPGEAREAGPRLALRAAS